MFNWKTASLEECAWHIAKVSAQQTTAILTYYKKKQDFNTLDKLLRARIIAKRYRVLLKAQAVEQELLKESLDNASNLTIFTKVVGE